MKDYYEYYQECDFEDLKGKTLVEIKQDSAEWLYLTDSEGNQYRMLPDKDVSLESRYGEFKDILNQEILLAECVEEHSSDKDTISEYEEWTFYKLSTLKGSLTLRWYGVSNGFYSTSVDFGRLTRRDKTQQEIDDDIKYEIAKKAGKTNKFILPFGYAVKEMTRVFETNPTRRLSKSPTLKPKDE